MEGAYDGEMLGKSLPEGLDPKDMLKLGQAQGVLVGAWINGRIFKGRYGEKHRTRCLESTRAQEEVGV